jgi:hypothetical protein
MPTDHIYELHTAIINALNNDTELAAMINGVYANVPNDAKFPFVAVDNVSAFDAISRTTSGWNVKIAINIFSRARDNQEASNIIAQIRSVLSGAALTTASGSVNSIKESSSLISRQKDGITWQGTSNFDMLLQQGSGIFVANGNNFLVKLGNGATPTELFTTIGGLRNAGISLSNKLVNCSNLSTGKWQSLVSGAGFASVAVSGNGFFTDSAAENTLCSLAFSRAVNNYQIIMGNNYVISGGFIVSAYKRTGALNLQEGVEIALESTDAILFTIS